MVFWGQVMVDHIPDVRGTRCVLPRRQQFRIVFWARPASFFPSIRRLDFRGLNQDTIRGKAETYPGVEAI